MNPPDILIDNIDVVEVNKKQILDTNRHIVSS